MIIVLKGVVEPRMESLELLTIVSFSGEVIVSEWLLSEV